MKKKSLRAVIGKLQTDKTMSTDFNEIRKIAHDRVGREYMKNDLDEENDG